MGWESRGSAYEPGNSWGISGEMPLGLTGEGKANAGSGNHCVWVDGHKQFREEVRAGAAEGWEVERRITKMEPLSAGRLSLLLLH